MPATSQNVIGDQMTYVVVCLSKTGPYIAERSLADCGRKSTIEDIASGELSDVVQVLEVNPVENICNDVTKDIAWAVSEHLSDGGEPLSDHQRDFIEEHLGVIVAHSFPRAA